MLSCKNSSTSVTSLLNFCVVRIEMNFCHPENFTQLIMLWYRRNTNIQAYLKLFYQQTGFILNFAFDQIIITHIARSCNDQSNHCRKFGLDGICKSINKRWYCQSTCNCCSEQSPCGKWTLSKILVFYTNLADYA